MINKILKLENGTRAKIEQVLTHLSDPHDDKDAMNERLRSKQKNEDREDVTSVTQRV